VHTTPSPSPDHSYTHSPKNHIAKPSESSPCAPDFRSYEIDYDEISECTESLLDISHHKGLTARGNEIAPAKMPLMRIRSVEIVFEDEMSACTDTALLDRSIELIVSDSDDSTKCVDDIEHLQAEPDCDDNSVTLNADGDLSDDNSVSLVKDNVDAPSTQQTEPPDIDDSTNAPSECVLSAIDDITLSSLNISEVADSGRFTEDACSSHMETVPIVAYEDALLSNSLDVITVDNALKTHEVNASRIKETEARLYEHIDSNSDSSENTAVCDVDFSPVKHLTPFRDVIAVEDNSLCDTSDLQYDSFIDMGKF
jgi:hypothetical protein